MSGRFRPVFEHLPVMLLLKGLLVRAYLSDRQKICVRKNGGVARFVYNRLVAVDREKHKLAKTLPYSPADRARMSYLKDAYATTAALRNAIPFLNDPLVDGYAIANAKKIILMHGGNSKK